jgi:hypothetical protein
MPKGKPALDAAKCVALSSTRQLQIRKFGFSPKFRKGKGFTIPSRQSVGSSRLPQNAGEHWCDRLRSKLSIRSNKWSKESTAIRFTTSFLCAMTPQRNN